MKSTNSLLRSVKYYAAAMSLVIVSGIEARAGQLPALSARELSKLVKASEEKILSVKCEGQQITLLRKSFADELRWDEGFKVDIIWAYKGVWGSKQYYATAGEMPWIDGPVPSTKARAAWAYNGEISTYCHEDIRNPEKPIVAGIIDPDGTRCTDQFERTQIGRSTFWRYRVPLSKKLLENGVDCRPDMWDGRDTYRVELQSLHGTGKDILWLDPLRGFNYVHSDDGGEAETDIVLQEACPGIWFPKESISVGQSSAVRVDVKSVRINESLPDELFVLHFKPGTWITDNRTGTSYYAGMDGKERENTAAKLVENVRQRYLEESKNATIELTPPQPPEPAASPQAQVPGNSSGLSRLVGGALALLALVLAVVVFRLLHERSHTEGKEKSGP